MIDHLDDDAELYAVGALDDAARRRVEQHAAGCESCSSRLAQAQETVAQLAAGQPQFDPPKTLEERLSRTIRPGVRMPLWPALAAAAVLALAFVPTWLAVDRTRLYGQSMQQDERALARIAAAPSFNRAVFRGARGPMAAKVLYGTHGDWYYVLVMHPPAGMQVAYVHGGRMQMLGTLVRHGASGTLYLPVNHRMEELALLTGTIVIAHAHLIY